MEIYVQISFKCGPLTSVFILEQHKDLILQLQKSQLIDILIHLYLDWFVELSRSC